MCSVGRVDLLIYFAGLCITKAAGFTELHLRKVFSRFESFTELVLISFVQFSVFLFWQA